MEFHELVNLCLKKKIVCLVGAGGKTSIMEAIAKTCASLGKNVVVTTSTHIFKPKERYAENIEQVQEVWKQGEYAVIGQRENHKLTQPPKEYFDWVLEQGDLVLVEADGSKRYPAKIPRDHEPVIIQEAQLVIGVLGMSALGKKIKDVCFSFETDGSWLQVSKEACLTEEIVVQILASELGTRKGVENRNYVVVLNQCDNDSLVQSAKKIGELLEVKYQIPWLYSSVEMRMKK